jgi:hypothetical protein
MVMLVVASLVVVMVVVVALMLNRRASEEDVVHLDRRGNLGMGAVVAIPPRFWPESLHVGRRQVAEARDDLGRVHQSNIIPRTAKHLEHDGVRSGARNKDRQHSL